MLKIKPVSCYIDPRGEKKIKPVLPPSAQTKGPEALWEPPLPSASWGTCHLWILHLGHLCCSRASCKSGLCVPGRGVEQALECELSAHRPPGPGPGTRPVPVLGGGPLRVTWEEPVCHHGWPGRGTSGLKGVDTFHVATSPRELSFHS